MLFSRTDKSFIGQWWWTVDRPMLVAFLVLAVLGVMLVTTASPPVAAHLNLGYYHFLERHCVFLLPSMVLLLGVSTLSRKNIWRLASLIFVGGLIAMVLVLFIGMEIKGARRWIHVLGFSLQPSEFAKPAFLIVSAWLMALNQQKIKQRFFINTITGAVGLYFLVVFLLLMEPDLGMTVITTAAWMAQVFLVGLPFRYVFVMVGLGAGGLVTAYFSLDHVHSRINRFLDPGSGDNFQVEKSIEAFRNGGFLGTGPGQGTVKMHLPDAHADFIFSVAGEEMGLMFVAVVIAIYGFILLRGYNRLIDSEDMFAVLAAGSLLTMFGLQALVHMGSALNLLPAKGMTLPFISYGGSSLISMGFSMGVVLGLTRRQGRAGISKTGLSLFSSSGAVKKSNG